MKLILTLAVFVLATAALVDAKKPDAHKKNSTVSTRHYFQHNNFRPQNFGNGGRTPGCLLTNPPQTRCAARQAPLTTYCPQQPQCTMAAQRTICNEYIDSKLVERFGIAPATYANITWPTRATAQSGNLLKMAQVSKIPSSITYPTKPNTLYTIILQDAGETPVPITKRDIGMPAHWLVVNIPGTNVTAGDAHFSYFIPIGAPPPFLTSPTLFNLFVYEQRTRLVLDEARIPACSFTGRSFFKTDKFAEKYQLIGPESGNFIRVDFIDPTDTSVKDLRTQCAAYFTEQFRLAGLPYQISGGFTTSWKGNNFNGYGNTLRPADLGADQPQTFAQYFDPTQKYTVVLLDEDFGTATPKQPYMNWLVVNAGFRTLVTVGTPIIEYQRPAPANDGLNHRFVALLYQQQKGVDIDPTKYTKILKCDTTQARSEFKLDDFVKANNLQLLDGSYSLMQYDGTTAC